MSLKSCFCISLFSLAAIHAPAQTNPGRNEKLEVQVMLLENVKELKLPDSCKFKHGDLQTTDAVLKYKVIKVINGFYLQKTILIHQQCLREAIENKQIDNHITYVYKLRAVNPEVADKTKLTYEIVL